MTWLTPTVLVSVEDNNTGKKFNLGVPSSLHKYWLSENLIDHLCQEISTSYKGPFQIEILETGKNVASPNDPDYSLDAHFEQEDLNTQLSLSFNEPEKPQQKRDFLNPDYTFSTFVVGNNNEFAHATAYRIADALGPVPLINPLYIFGPTGMGKTHLLHAIGNHVRQKFPQIKICYVSAEKMMNEFLSYMRNPRDKRDLSKFREKYRENFDILLCDDIQIIGRGEAFQEEFFATLRTFIEAGKQVAVASDRMPRDIPGLLDRIRTRLEGGVIADIKMPDIENRMAILRYKADSKGIRIPDDALQFIARISKRSIRELEGTLNTVKMFAELMNLPLNLETVKKALNNHSVEASTLTADDVKKMVAEQFNIRLTDLTSANRSKPIVTARQSAMYLIRKHLDKSLQDIGTAFGGKDHTTVMSAINKITKQLDLDTELRRNIDDLEAKIHNITGL